jgi:hypothetical protein
MENCAVQFRRRSRVTYGVPHPDLLDARTPISFPRGWRGGCDSSRHDSYGESSECEAEGKTGAGLSPIWPPGKQSVMERFAVHGLRRRPDAAEGSLGGAPERASRSEPSRQTADSRTLPRPAVGRFCFRRGNSQPHGVAAAPAWPSAQREGRSLSPRKRLAPSRLRGARCGVVLRYTTARKATRRVSGCRTLWRRRRV